MMLVMFLSFGCCCLCVSVALLHLLYVCCCLCLVVGDGPVIVRVVCVLLLFVVVVDHLVGLVVSTLFVRVVA